MKPKPVRQQFADTMLAVGQEDPRLVVLVGDISHFILQPFAEACPGRYYNVGICEPTIVSMAAGLSKVGFRPVVHTIAPFLIERSFEQIKLDFCYHMLAGNIVTTGSAFDYSNLGCTHHCYGDFALLKTLQNVQIVYPASAIEFDALFRSAYANSFLTIYRMTANQHGVEFTAADIVLGRGVKVMDGGNLTIIATGSQLGNALAARALLAAKGWDAEVLYIHTIRPLDAELIRASAAKTRRVVVVEEHLRSGGLGDDVRWIAQGLESVSVASISIPDRFITEYGSYQEHCEALGLTAEGILRRVSETFGARPPRTEAARPRAAV